VGVCLGMNINGGTQSSLSCGRSSLYWGIQDSVMSELAANPGINANQLTATQAATRLEHEAAAFWQGSVTRLEKEQRNLAPDELEYGKLIAEYARARLAAMQAALAVNFGERERAADLQKEERETLLLAARAQRLYLLAGVDHPLRGWGRSAGIVALGNRLSGRHWQCTLPPPVLRKLPSPKDSPTDGPAARQAAGCRAQRLFVEQDYVALDKWLETSEAGLGDLPDGSSTFDGIVRGMDDLFSYQTAYPTEILRQTLVWQHRVPKSTYPKFMQIFIFNAWAWQARGSGSAQSVSQQAWALFAQRTEMAAEGLRELELNSAAKGNPLRYALALDVGLDESKSRNELYDILRRGVIAHPEYGPLYIKMLRILSPRLLGNRAEIRTSSNGRPRHPAMNPPPRLRVKELGN
jgi:hypothetical protein